MGRPDGGSIDAAVPYFICPNCRRRHLDHDGREGLTHQSVGCDSCGFGFLFELMDDYYPAPGAGLVVCDANRRVLAAGRGVFELTGYQERDVLGHDVVEGFGLAGFEPEKDPARLAVEWGVRRLGEELQLRTKAGTSNPVAADFFPAYDADGGLVVALAPR